MTGLVSVITPVHAPSLPHLRDAYESLRTQESRTAGTGSGSSRRTVRPAFFAMHCHWTTNGSDQEWAVREARE